MFIDNADVRLNFPATRAMLYVDAAHQAPLAMSVYRGVERYYLSALAAAGPKSVWMEQVEVVRTKLGSTLGVPCADLAFTKNASEGLNAAANGLHWIDGDNVVILHNEHPNNAYAWIAKRDRGLAVREVRPAKAWADAYDFIPAIDRRTRSISISDVMFHNGVRNDVASIAELANARHIPLVVDVTQSVGVLPLEVESSPYTILVAGCHKGLLTPHGLGFLCTGCAPDVFSPAYVAAAGVANASLDPEAATGTLLLHGDARRFEIGNYNLPALYGLGAALDVISTVGIDRIAEHVLDLGERLIERLKGTRVRITAPRPRNRRSHIYVLSSDEVDVGQLLESAGVRYSSVPGGARVSFGLFSSPNDVDRLADILLSTVRVQTQLTGQPARSTLREDIAWQN